MGTNLPAPVIITETLAGVLPVIQQATTRTDGYWGWLHENDDRWRGMSLPDVVLASGAGDPDSSVADDMVRFADPLRQRMEQRVAEGYQIFNDVAGFAPDVAAYLEGDPECMYACELVPAVKYDRTVRICASVSASQSVDHATMRRRGGVALAACQLAELAGCGVEVWAHMDAASTGTKSGWVLRIAVRIKAASEPVDARLLAYWLASPAALRGSMFTLMGGMASKWLDAAGRGRGRPCQPEPAEHGIEADIVVPHICATSDAVAVEFLEKELARIGVLT